MMITFTTSTKTFSRTILCRCVLGAACLLVIVGLQSCRTAAISATALDLNNYQTGRTLPQDKLAVTSVFAYAPGLLSTISGPSNGQVGQSISSLPAALTTQLGCELPLAGTWQAGAFTQLSCTNFPFDWDAGLRAYVKKEVTDTLSPFDASILVGAGIQWGTKSRREDIVLRPVLPWGIEPPIFSLRDTTITITVISSEISSQVNRVHVALPMSWRIQANSTSQSHSAFTDSWTDICITPAVHLVHQNIYLQDSSYNLILRNRLETRTTTVFAGTRHIITPYIIPSLSFGACLRSTAGEFFPEATIAWANNALTFGVGVYIRGLLSK